MASTTYPPYSGAAPGFRVSIFFTQQGDLLGGWSENFWYLGNNVANCQADAQRLRTLLLNCKAQNIWSPRIRISLVGGSRTIWLITFSNTSNPGGAGAITASIAGVKALVALCNAAGQSTSQWIGGLSHNNFSPNSRWNPDPGVSTALGAVFAFLGNGSWGIRKVAFGASPNNLTPISSITQAGVVTAPNHGLTLGGTARVGKCPTGFGLDGLWPYTFIDGNTLQLQPTPSFPSPILLPPKSHPYIHLYQWVMTAIAAPQTNPGQQQQTRVLRATTHHIGRPPAQYIGRRKRRAS